MIKQIELTNFRRHTDAVLNFGAGLQVIRGLNEAGKSTFFEAAAYAMFGSKALRTTFDDTVTWGCKPATLKVHATICIDGDDYVFTRSKAGAECVYQGGMVTGQNEVSQFAGKLLGVDGATASLLMMSNQGSLRGALEAGPKAVSEMIESLADFDLFEVIIEKMQEKLTLGAVGPAEARIEEARAALEEVPAPVKPDVADIEANAAAFEVEIAAKSKWIEEIGEPNYQAALTAFNTAEYMQTQSTAAVARLASAEAAASARRQQIRTGKAAAALKPDASLLPALKADLAAAKDHTALMSTHKAVTDVVAAYDGDFWEGDLASLEAAIAEDVKASGALERERMQWSGDIREARATMVTSSHCGFCNQDISQFPEVAKRNAAAEKLIADTEAKILAHTIRMTDIGIGIEDMKAVLAANAKFVKVWAAAGALAEAEGEYVPPRLVWQGKAPGAAPDVKALQASIATLEAEINTAVRAEVGVEMNTAALIEDEQRVAAAAADVEKNPAPGNLEALEAARFDASNVLLNTQWATKEMEQQVLALRSSIGLAEQAYAVAAARRTELQDRVAKAKADLAALNFNNALLKKVRQARPIISDKLWNTVLSAVSTMFSQMRGETSVVTKGKDGFSVNGATFTSLSGSTLDLLGLAIRIALVKTFIPRCSFLILDEPFAACDEERSARMLGFIAAAGFQQTIVITHEEASEAVADNLVYV